MPVGIPHPSRYPDPGRAVPGDLLTWLRQRHEARRAGTHQDIRIGSPRLGLWSWATRKDLPEPGSRIQLYEQPIHSYSYKDFEGMIGSGYGAGRVTKAEEGRLLLTGVDRNHIRFTLAHTRHPERFILIRSRRDPHKWLMVNTTPSKPIGYEKIHYKLVPGQEIDRALKMLRDSDSVQAKIDGAAALLHVGRKHVEMLSYRTSTSGRPIVHTERVLYGRPEIKIPPELRDTLLRGEIFGVRDGHPIPSQELGGILNSSVARSIEDQKARNVRLRMAIFDLVRERGRPVDPDTVSYDERRRRMAEILKKLDLASTEIVPEVRGRVAAQELWDRIVRGEYPHTEGLVIHPQLGTPTKVKIRPEQKVWITGIFPGEGKYSDAAGGFTYSLEPGGPSIGRVGTGLSDEMRHELQRNPDAYIGRAARVTSQGSFPSGALRAPSLVALHEDIP